MCQVKKRQRSVTERPVGVGLDPPDPVAVVDRDMPGDHLGGQRQDGVILAVEDLDEDHAERTDEAANVLCHVGLLASAGPLRLRFCTGHRHADGFAGIKMENFSAMN